MPGTGIEDMKTGDFNIFAHNYVKWRSNAFYVGFDRVFKASQKFNSNYKIIDSLRTAKNISDLKLNSIQNAYGIKTNCDVSGNTYKFSLSGNKQIDSALLLLPYYRDYISYDPQDNSWNVELPRKRGTVKIQTK